MKIHILYSLKRQTSIPKKMKITKWIGKTLKSWSKNILINSKWSTQELTNTKDILPFQATNATKINLPDSLLWPIKTCQPKTSHSALLKMKISKNFGKNKVDTTSIVLHQNWESPGSKIEKFKSWNVKRKLRNKNNHTLSVEFTTWISTKSSLNHAQF